MNFPRTQQGFLLFIAVIFILVVGVMGMLMAYTFSNRAGLSVAQLNGLRAFYQAESGLEIAARLLTMPNITGTPNRLACSSLTGTSTVTNAAIGAGTFTVTGTSLSGATTLSASLTASSTSLPLTSATGFASAGRVLVDQEAIDYAGISGDTLIGLTRGSSQTLAAAHLTGTAVSQFQCSLNSKSGIPNLTVSNYQRELKSAVQLQDAWLVGNVSGSNFTMAHFNDPTEEIWNNANLAGGTNAVTLNGISMLSNADGWAVGNAVSSKFIILRYNGTNWVLTTQTACSGQHLLDVSAVSSREAWVVGDIYKPTNCSSGSDRYTIMRWNGSTWTLLTPTSSPSIPADDNNNDNMNAVHVIDTTGSGIGNFGFAVGDNGEILQYNGSTWTRATSPTTQHLYGVEIVSTTNAWAVGNGGVILRFNGSTWSLVTSPTTRTLRTVAMLDASIGWAVGANGTILTYNGSSWSTQTSNTSTNLFGVSIFNAKDVWAVGASGFATHWNGSTWAAASSGTSGQLNDVCVVAPGRTAPVSSWQQVFQ